MRWYELTRNKTLPLITVEPSYLIDTQIIRPALVPHACPALVSLVSLIVLVALVARVSLVSLMSLIALVALVAYVALGALEGIKHVFKHMNMHLARIHMY